ncbi:MAG: ABC transporter permease [Alphaproteobacteria bacterium]|nr:ABC transporter permease [Alphaproteobacteria bacterium]
MDIDFYWSTFLELLTGVPLMAQLVSLSLAVGFVLAVFVALIRLSRWRLASGIAYGYVYVFRGTPLLVQMFLIYYGLGQFEWIRESFLWVFLRQPYWCAILAFTLNTGAYGSEIIRGGLQSVPWGQIEAARAAGMSGWLLFRRITMPIGIRQALPAYGNEMILMVKATSLASIITMLEITGIAQRLISQSYRAVEILVVAGVIYLMINFMLTRLVKWLEHWLSPHLRDAPVVATPAAALAH